MDTVENISHWFSLSPVSLKHTLQVDGLAPNIRYKYFTNNLYNLYITQDKNFMRKGLHVFSFSIAKRSHFPRLSGIPNLY